LKVFDFIIVGSWISGLTSAVLAGEKWKVLLITKEVDLRSWSSFIWKNWLAATQNADFHIKDTMKESHHTSSMSALEFFVSHSWSSFLWLKNEIWVGFLDEPKAVSWHLENRIWETWENTWEDIVNKLIYKIEQNENISVITEFKVSEVLTKTISVRHSRTEKIWEDKVTWVFWTKGKKKVSLYWKNILLATWWIWQQFWKTTNSKSSTWDGIELAKTVWAKIKNMDLIQWYPFCLKINRNPIFYFDATIVWEWAYIVNNKWERFLRKYHKDWENAPLSTISNAFFAEEKSWNWAYFDFRHKQKIFWRKRFPYTVALLEEYWFDIEKDIIPITSAVHYLCGWIEVDTHCRTSIPWLYAIWEVADTGLHWVNPLIWNSITESLVWAKSFVNSVEL